MMKVSLGIQRNIRRNFLLILLIAALILIPSPAYAQSWKDMAEKAAVEYADDKAADFIQETLQGQLDTQLQKLETKWRRAPQGCPRARGMGTIKAPSPLSSHRPAFCPAP